MIKDFTSRQYFKCKDKIWKESKVNPNIDFITNQKTIQDNLKKLPHKNGKIYIPHPTIKYCWLSADDFEYIDYKNEKYGSWWVYSESPFVPDHVQLYILLNNNN